MSIDKKINVFFFPSSKSHTEYGEYYKKVNPLRYGREGVVRYSPIYLLMRDIRHCFALGQEFNTWDNREGAMFAGLVLLNIATTETARHAYGYGDVRRFTREYMKIGNLDLQNGLRYLRNSLEHSYYSLSYVINNSSVDGGKEKIYFRLSLNFDYPIARDTTWCSSYPSRMYNVNPRKVFSSYDDALKAFKNDLLNTKKRSLRVHFESHFSLDNWVTF